MKNIIFLLFSILVLTSCDQKVYMGEKNLKYRLNGHSGYYQSFWKKQVKESEQSLFLKKSKKSQEYINIHNKIEKRSNDLEIIEWKANTERLISSSIERLPKTLLSDIRKYVIGFYLAKNTGTDAFSYHPLESHSKSFIVIDEKTLNARGNEWCEQREASPFDIDQLKINCILFNEKPAEENPVLTFILFREIGKALALHNNLIPSTLISSYADKKMEDFPFTALNWKLQDSKPKINDDQFEVFKMVRFFKEYKLPESYSTRLYKLIYNSPFPTISSATNLWDDFGDSFSHYIHTQILKRPFIVQVVEKDQVIAETNQNFWSQETSLTKKEIFKKLTGI